MTPSIHKNESMLNTFDLNNDGILSPEELMAAEKIAELESVKAKEKDRNAKEDQFRQMAWAAMASMLLYTFILFLPIVSVERIEALDSLLQMFYIAQAGIVASFFGSSAYMSRN
jgi:hypothetical protein